MRGYTKEQLEAESATVADYVLCSNCSLYWHRRDFGKHLNVVPLADSDGDIEITHPAVDRFFEFLAKTAVERWVKDRGERIARGEPVVVSPPKEAPPAPPRSLRRRMTVDEAAAEFAVSREEILHEFERRMVPFEFTVPAPPSRRRAQKS